jgi:glycosyltransferase involved in cell wall biosynthesis
MSEQRRLRVAVISKADSSGGGASRVAELSVRLFAPHYDVQHFVLYSRDTRPPRYQLRHFEGLSWFERECEKASNWIGIPDHISIDWLIFMLRTRLQVDLIHCHDISSALSPLSMRLLSKVAPVVWTLHDCSPFTGGCLYPMECHGFETECGPCPQLGRWPLTTQTDRTGWMQRNKRALGHTRRVYPICPSRWMGEMAVKARVFANEPQLIPYYVDSKVFQPHHKEFVRRENDMPAYRFTVLLSSHSLTDTRKGFQLAAAALDSIRDLNPVVLLVGHAGVEVKSRLKGLDVVTSGYIHDEALLSKWYASADVLLIPTLADNLPNVIMETMACGTPSVGFATGGVPDMVDHDRNGWLVPTGDIAGLAAGLRVAATQRRRWNEWRDRAIADAREKYSPTRFLESHARLYQRLTGVPAPIHVPALSETLSLAG